MGNLLAEISEEIEKILPQVDTLDGGPEEDPNGDDHELGECGPEVKALWHLCQRYGQERQALLGKMLMQLSSVVSTYSHKGERPDKLPPDALALMHEQEVLTGKMEAVSNLMWTQLRSDFPDSVNKHSVGVRSGWIAVWSEPQMNAGILKAILGI